MARAAVIPAAASPQRTMRTVKRTTTTTSRSGAAKPAGKLTKGKAPTSATENRKRTARMNLSAMSRPADDDSDDDTDDELGMIDTKEKPPVTKIRGRSTGSTAASAGRERRPTTTKIGPAGENEDDDAHINGQKKRVGRPKATPATGTESAKLETAPKPRGRPKGSTTTKSATTTAADVQKKTRPLTGVDTSSQSGTREVTITTNSTIMRSNLLRGPAKKKTVTFKDVSDSEDALSEPSPPPPAGRRRPATTSQRPAGLAAKPARKGAMAVGRGRKPAATKKGTSKPLSPKKATQVAKGISSYASSDDEDDELSAKDQNKQYVDSPKKHGSEPTGLNSPVKRINFTSSQPPKLVDENGEPMLQPPKSIDFSDTAFLSSPARRPPPSPFSFTIRETPRRGGFALRDDAKPAQPNFTPTDNSPLKSSPKKANLETPKRGNLGFHDDIRPLSQPNFTPAHNSPLKTSPKKGLFAASLFSQSSVQECPTPFKSQSLLHSPAKRVVSPFKSSLLSKRSPVTQDLEFDSDDDEEMDGILSPEAARSPFQRHDSEETLEMPDEYEEFTETPADRHGPGTPEPEAEPEFVESKDIPHAAEYELEDETDEQPLEHDEIQEDVMEDMGMGHADTESEHDEDAEEPMESIGVDREGTVQSEESIEGIYELFEGQYEIVENILMDDQFSTDFEERFDGYAPEIPQDYTVCLEVAEQDASHPVQDVQNTGDSENELEQLASADRSSVTSDAEEDIAALGDQQNEELEDRDSESADDAQGEYLQAPAEFSSRETMLEGLEDVFTEAPGAQFQMRDDGQGTESHAESVEPVGDHSLDSNCEYDEEELNVLDEYDFDDEEATLVAFDTPRRTPRQTPQRTLRRTPARTFEGTPRQTPAQTPRQIFGETPRQVPRQTTRQTPAQRTMNPQIFTPYEIEEPPTPQDPKFLPSFAAPWFPDEYRDSAEESMNSGAADITTEVDIPAHDIQPSPHPEHDIPGLENERRNRPRFTLLAEQLSRWKASSPAKTEQRRLGRRGVFSLSGNLSGRSDVNNTLEDVTYPDLSTKSQSPIVDELQPNDDPAALEPEDDQEEPEIGRCAFEDLEKSPGLPMFEIFSDQEPEEVDLAATRENTQVSIVYESPMRPDALSQEILDDEKENCDVQLPAPVTPVRRKTNPMQTFHTVSKVPLKPEGEISPLKMSRKRGRSLSITSPTRASPRLRRSILAPRADMEDYHPPRKAPRLSYSTMPQLQPSRSRSSSKARVATPGGERKKSPSRSPSPAKSPRRRSSVYQPTCTGPLQGAIVYVDVHTTEGEDASGIFVELLQQMGARCVKNWSWNPRSSVSPDEQAESREGKVGITHVVYKDGGVRTMEKVRQARGLVKCIGVGWVLDCERESKWLDETHYAVDSSIIPRGGAKRRKSMEPRALSHINGTLVKAHTTLTSSRLSGVAAVGDFVKSSTSTPSEMPSTPKRSKNSEAGYPEVDQKYFQTPKTPGYAFDMDAIGMSPATPFFLSQRSKLVQQTCPPKQLRQGLFSSSGLSEEQSQKLRVKLEAARRKSLAFKPKIGSPLVK
ncbi:hypothetical protein BDV28DRAFT_63279 [Aspergillus coremiiformis]|uniref:BRCT domain-containing protein n=1 Tax=Aspergillus coremiiformis TaxID=138285 RepID=A0A5N6YUZ6_9EURO|nr:hypothetical protein BDV28DRAFT_63279 [Aspergillus coremiiformis]